MAHTIRDKDKLLKRVRRLRGQIEALEKALIQGTDCYRILQQIAACRGAAAGLMAEVLEGHVREHLMDGDSHVSKEKKRDAEELISVLKTYLR